MRSLLLVTALLLVACDANVGHQDPPKPLARQRAAERNIGISPSGGLVYCIGGCPGFGISLSGKGTGFGF